MKKLYVYLSMSLVLLFNWVATGALSSAESVDSLAFESCHVAGIEAKAQCLNVSVPEDWSNPQGKAISLFVAVIPPSGGQAIKAPLYVLAGGPGQPASTLGPNVQFGLEQARRGREVVLLDQRGTGKSTPFGCKLSLDPTINGGDFARDCLASTDNQPQFYNSAAFMRDLDTVRETLGHDQINLLGGSYGTRAALLYLREYPERVRSLILDAVAAPETAFFERFHQSASRALEKLFVDCAADSHCSQSYPNLEASFNQLIARLAVEPVTLRGPQEYDLTPDTLLNTLRNALYSPLSTAQLPLVIDEAAKGNYAPVNAIAGGMSVLYQDMSIGTMLSVLCGEEIHSTTPQTVAQLAQGRAFENVSMDFWFDACAVWPHTTVDERYREPVSSDVPVLLLSGEQDPVTPPAFGHQAAARLSNAAHVVAPFGGHTIGAYGCIPALVGTFLDTLEPNTLDASCLDDLTREPFAVGAFGPQP